MRNGCFSGCGFVLLRDGLFGICNNLKLIAHSAFVIGHRVFICRTRVVLPKFERPTLNTKRVLSLQRSWKFDLLVPYQTCIWRCSVKLVIAYNYGVCFASMGLFLVKLRYRLQLAFSELSVPGELFLNDSFPSGSHHKQRRRENARGLVEVG